MQTILGAFMKISVWVLGAIAAYRLWGNVTWLSVFVIILALSYSVHKNEQQEHNATGMYSNTTAKRLMWTFILVMIIFIYSLFK